MRITVRIDRPLGSAHPRHPDLIYLVNYGEVVGVPAPDGDWQDAVIHRRDDIETKWVIAPEGATFTAEEIMAAVHFQEQYFDAYVEMTEE